MSRATSHDPSTRILMDVSIGRITVIEGARQLELQDVGYLFHRLAEAGLPLPRLSKEADDHQLAQAKHALDACLVESLSARPRRCRPCKPMHGSHP